MSQSFNTIILNLSLTTLCIVAYDVLKTKQSQSQLVTNTGSLASESGNAVRRYGKDVDLTTLNSVIKAHPSVILQIPPFVTKDEMNIIDSIIASSETSSEVNTAVVRREDVDGAVGEILMKIVEGYLLSGQLDQEKNIKQIDDDVANLAARKIKPKTILKEAQTTPPTTATATIPTATTTTTANANTPPLELIGSLTRQTLSSIYITSTSILTKAIDATYNTSVVINEASKLFVRELMKEDDRIRIGVLTDNKRTYNDLKPYCVGGSVRMIDSVDEEEIVVVKGSNDLQTLTLLCSKCSKRRAENTDAKTLVIIRSHAYKQVVESLLDCVVIIEDDIIDRLY
jgi:hypothetical protein